MKNINFLVVGVGGQGTILSGDILAEVGMSAGYDSKKSDILGLAIRGGSVASHVRWGKKVSAPMSMKGTIDYLLAFEPLEAIRVVKYLNQNSIAIVNEYPVPPMDVMTGKSKYPSIQEMRQVLTSSIEKVYPINATQKAEEVGNVRVVNVLLLGALSSICGPSQSIWNEVIKKYVPKRFLEINLSAFQAGRTLISKPNNK